jgi:hypothetical protein
MKNITTLFLFFLISVQVKSQTATCDGSLPFEEKDGLLTIEMESGKLNDDRWKIGNQLETINNQQIETKYIYWSGSESFNALSGAPITYKIKINNPGTYRFAWRMRVGLGTSTGEHNDAWLKIDGEDFFGIKDGAKVYPKPMCSNNTNLTCAAGTSTQNFIKAYGNRLDWTFVTNTNDHVAHRVFVTFNEAKEYTITVDARSSFLFIDKMVLRREGISDSVAFDLNNPESQCFNTSLNTIDHSKPQIKISPNPTNGKIEIKNLPIKTNLFISNILGSVIREIHIASATYSLDISDLKRGVYFLSNTDKNNYFVKKIIKL